MTDHRANLAGLRRPSLLIRAARLGLADYRRERDLHRLIPGETPPHGALPKLFEEEERIETIRRKGDVTYSAKRHIEVLIALMGEVRRLPALVPV